MEEHCNPAIKRRIIMKENREVKSDAFCMLMEEKENALQVYNALNGSNYTEPELIEMQTLENGISLSIRNDAAFIVNMNLEIYEHQSTYNPNMPLRGLIYFTDIIKKRIKDSNRDLLGRTLIKIPNPHFVVFYNGKENRPPVQTLRLSDAFENKEDNPMLDLECTVYNINSGKNENLLANCEVLNNYMIFIDKVREFNQLGREEPITEAIEWCIRNDILADFLRRRGDEVKKAMTIDMTWEHREEIIRAEEREAGRAEGIEAGRAEGIETGRAEGQADIINNMIVNGMSIEAISGVTGLSVEEIEKLTSEK